MWEAMGSGGNPELLRNPAAGSYARWEARGQNKNQSGEAANAADTQGSGQGRGKNNRQPDSEATGDHAVVNQKGATTFKRNDKNPSGRDKSSNIDKEGAPHFNKKTGKDVPTPHRQGEDVDGNKIPGGVAPLAPNEVPNYKGIDEKDYIPSQFRN